MAPATPCKTCKKSKNGEIRSKTNEFKPKFACILEASESTKLRMEESLPNYHEDHIAGRGDNSLQRYNLVHQFIPMPQAMKIPAAKTAVDKEWEKLEKIRHGSWRKSEVNQRSSVIWRMPNWRQSTKNTKVELYSETILWKMILDLMQYLQNKDHQRHKWLQQKVMGIISRLPGCAGQAADAVSADYTQVKMEDAPKLLKNPESECPDIRIRLPRHKWPKSWSSMEDPLVPLERNLLAGQLWERQFEKILLKYCWEKVPDWECLFVHREKGLLLSVYVGDIKLAGKKHNINPMWKVLSVQNKDFTGDGKEFTKVSRAVAKTKSHLHWQFIECGKYCEDYFGFIEPSTPHRSETSGIAERAVRRVKERTSAILLQSGLGERWWADSIMLLRTAQCPRPLGRREKSARKTIWRTIQRAINSFWSTGWIQREIYQDFINLVRKYYLESFLYMSWSREDWERRYSDCGFGRFEKLDESEIYLRRINAKEERITQKGNEFIFLVADGTAKLSGRDDEFREPTPRLEQAEKR